MGRLSNLRVVDPVLSGLATGYSNVEFVAQNLMPFVSVDAEGGKIPKFGKDAFRVYNTERALRAKSNRIVPDEIESVTVALDEHDLEYPIDYREDAEAAFPLQQHATFRVMEGIRLRHEKMVADLVQDASKYAVGNKVALAAGTQFSHVDSVPETVIDVAKAAVRAATGREPNTMVMGYAVWRQLKLHAKLKATISTNQTRLVTINDLREIFGIENIVVGRSIFQTAAGVMTDIWGKKAVLAYVPTGAPAANSGAPVRSVYEPSFGYTVRKGSSVVDTRMEDGKLEIVRCTEIFKPFLLGADAGYLIDDAVA